MSQRAAIRLRRRFKIKFRDLAHIGRPQYPREMSAEKSRSRELRKIETQRRMQQKKKRG